MELAIKLFTGGSGKDPEGLDDFKAALSAARMGLHLVAHWNMNLTAIEGYLMATRFGFQSFKGQKEHVGSLCTAFVDSCFQENARRWTLRWPFLTFTDLANEWNVFTATRVSSAPPRQPPAAKKRRSSSPGKWWFAQAADGDPCARFNEGRCTRARDACFAFNGAKLRHVCSVATGGGRWCGKRHPATNH